MADFKSTKEIYEWLIAGNSVVDTRIKTFTTIKFDDYGQLIYSNNLYAKVIFDNPFYFLKYKENSLSESLPKQNVLCWVSDINKEDRTNLAIIVEKLPLSFKDSNGNYWFLQHLL